MSSARKPWWQKATAVVSLSASGAVTGFSFAPRAAADISSPSKMMIHLMALDEAGQPAKSGQASTSSDARLRSAIVSVARYYLRMAAGKTPAEMEAVIWEHDSIDGADHGQSCAAFASLALELGARVVGERSWVTGGTSYPWPLHKWADVRVDPNPDSLGITSVRQDAEAHHRWHPLGDGYQPKPGDWVLFHGHVEVVTDYAGDVLHTIGGDSLPDYSVNAHDYHGSLAADGVTGFVNNGDLSPGGPAAGSRGAGRPAARHQASPEPSGTQPSDTQPPGDQPSDARPSDTQPATGQAAGDQAGGDQKGGHQKGGEPATRPAAHQHAAAQVTTLGTAAVPGTATVPGTTAAAGSAAARQAGGAAEAAPARHSSTAAHSDDDAGGPGPADGPVADEHEPHAAGEAAIPGLSTPTGHLHRHRSGARSAHGRSPAGTGHRGRTPAGSADIPGLAGPAEGTAPGPAPATPAPATPAAPPAPAPVAHAPAAHAPPARAAAHRYTRHHPSPAVHAGNTPAQQAFIAEVAPGAMAAQREWGVPASVTIAQAIDESAWGQSELAARDHNLFGIKGEGPAGAVTEPTQEYVHGQAVERRASFRVYQDVAQSISDHGHLIATSGYYTRAMANRDNPDAFAADLTGVYATDPDYGAKLVGLMRRYDLYRYDTAEPGKAAARSSSRPGSASRASATPAPARTQPGTGQASGPGPAPPAPTAAPGTSQPTVGSPASGQATPSAHGQPAPGQPAPGQAAHDLTAHDQLTPGQAAHGKAAGRPDGHGGPAPDASPGAADIPGIPDSAALTSPAAQGASRPAAQGAGRPAAQGASRPARAAQPGQRTSGPSSPPRAATPPAATQRIPRRPARPPGPGRPAPRRTTARPARHQAPVPITVQNAFAMTARLPLLRGEPLYKDVAEQAGIRWQLLAACDWMQCKAQPRYSPVHGEKLGTVNSDGTCYRTKSEALEQCADDLLDLSWAVYQIDLTQAAPLSVRDLANVFAAFRWGGLLKLHRTSAMEFPYSVAGLTDQHAGMRWPSISDPRAPDKPGSRFRPAFGAVPVVLILKYPATD